VAGLAGDASAHRYPELFSYRFVAELIGISRIGKLAAGLIFRWVMRIHSIALLALGFCGIPTSASAALLIQIDKSAQTLTVIRDGVTLETWPVSTGRSEHPTPSGSFTAFRMEADHYSKEWDDAPMPHSIFFTKQGHAIHGSFEVKRLGSPASHGCVRLAPENAAVLFALVTEEGLPNTKVVLTGSEQVALARINAQRNAKGARGGQAAQASAGSPPDFSAAGALPQSGYRESSPQPRYVQPPPYVYRSTEYNGYRYAEPYPRAQYAPGYYRRGYYYPY
jgi:hypothetical protein